MKSIGKLMNDHLAVVAQQMLSEQALKQFEGVEGNCIFHSDSVEILHGVEAENYRPYLRMHGEIQEISFDPKFAKSKLHDISAIKFNSGDGVSSDVYYRFDQDELERLVKMGYFDDKVDIVADSIMIDNDFELPVVCNVMMVEPAVANDVPIIFVDVKNASNMEYNTDSCGYMMSDYLKSVDKKVVKNLDYYRDVVEEKSHDVIYDDGIDDLFAEEVPVKKLEQTVMQEEKKEVVPASEYTDEELDIIESVNKIVSAKLSERNEQTDNIDDLDDLDDFDFDEAELDTGENLDEKPKRRYVPDISVTEQHTKSDSEYD